MRAPEIYRPRRKKGRKTKFEQQFSEDFADAEIISPKTKYIVDPEASSSKNNLMIIENDQLSAMVIKEIFHQHSISFTFVATEKEAIKEFEKKPYSMILIGINDPINFEYDLFKKINEEQSTKLKTIIVGFTTHITRNAISKDRIKHYDHLLVKPYIIDELLKFTIKFRKTKTEENIETENSRKSSFNLEQLIQVSNNNQEFISKMLDKFITTAIECAEEMDRGISESDWEKLKKTAHKCIPSYSIMGLGKLVNLLEYIEAHALEKDTETIYQNVHSFIAGNRTAISEIREYLRHRSH